MKLISKGNGKNFYGVENDGTLVEVIRIRGLFYRTKFVLGEGLRPIGEALKKSEFKLI